MLCTQGGELDVVKLLDFGMVKELEVDRDVGLTGAGTMAGTPLYMAPEAILTPDSVDVRTDIYALGAVAYYLLAGSEVFNGKSLVEVCSQHIHQAPEPLSSRGVTISAQLEAVIFACLEKDPNRRPESAADLRRQLEACAIEPWESSSASAWWHQYQPALDRAALQSTGEPRTIAVDGSPRSSGELAA
jgi:serine/threonine protein kinase